MTNLAILLARMDSKRLPGKHFEMIGDKSLLDHCLSRLNKGKRFSIVLATSDRPIDDPLVEWASKNSISVYRGSATDLRERIKHCLQKFGATRFARINADSPFVDAGLLDEAFGRLIDSDYDFCTNLLPRTFPYGVSVEVFTSKCFIEHIKNNQRLEDVTTYFYENAAHFKYYNIECDFGNFSERKLTIDTKEDLERIREMFAFDSRLFNRTLEELLTQNSKIDS